MALSEFLVVCHSMLNGNLSQIEKQVDETLGLGKYVPNRKVIPCFEGDLLQVQETGEIVFTHQSWFPLSLQKYKSLQAEGLVSPLNEILDEVAEYKQKNPDQKLKLCLELKFPTSKETIDATVRRLREYDISDAYFDSFLGKKLDLVYASNQTFGTQYSRSFHNFRFLSRLLLPEPVHGYEMLTVPYFCRNLGRKIDTSVIYGAVGSTERLRACAEEENVVGAYPRLKEGLGVKGTALMLWNSITNTVRLRKVNQKN